MSTMIWWLIQFLWSYLSGPIPNAMPMGMGPRDVIDNYPISSNCSRLLIQAPVGLTQGYLVKLFGLIPGMEYCDLNETTGMSFFMMLPNLRVINNLQTGIDL